MSNTFNLGTGTFYGNGYTGSGYANNKCGASSYNRVASSTNLNRVSRDIAQGYNQDIEIVDTYLQQGDITEALILYDELFNDAKVTADRYGYQLTDGQVSSILNQAYTDATGGSFTQTINQQTTNPFLTGIFEGIPVLGWFFAQSYSDAEAISKVSGIETRAKDKIAEVAGAALSGAAVGAVVGGVPGAIVGGALGVGSCLFKAFIDNN